MLAPNPNKFHKAMKPRLSRLCLCSSFEHLKSTLQVNGSQRWTSRCTHVLVLITKESPPVTTFSYIAAKAATSTPSTALKVIPGTPPSASSQERQLPPPESSRCPASGRAEGRVFGADNAKSLACKSKIRQHCIISTGHQHHARQWRVL